MNGCSKAESSSLLPKTSQKLWGFTWNMYFSIHFSWVYLTPQFWVQRPRTVSLGINSPCDWVEKYLYLATEGKVLCTTISYSTLSKFHGHILLWTAKRCISQIRSYQSNCFSQRSVLYHKCLYRLELSQKAHSMAMPWHWEHKWSHLFWWAMCNSTLEPVTSQRPLPSTRSGMLNYWQSRSLVIRLSSLLLPRPVKLTTHGQSPVEFSGPHSSCHNTAFCTEISPCPEPKDVSVWKPEIQQRERQIYLK